MNGFLNCMLYLAAIASGSFVIGRLIPKKLFCWNRFPWKPICTAREKALYRMLKVKDWQNKLPDMSRIFPKLMPPKKMPTHLETDILETMLRETCVADLIHGLLGVAGFFCIHIWHCGGIWLSIAFFIGNLPFIIIQRYNRPRLVLLLERQKKKIGVQK